MSSRVLSSLVVAASLTAGLLPHPIHAGNVPAAPKGLPIAVTVDHANAIYKQGETVTFAVKLTPNSALPKDAELSWNISKDGVAPKHDGKVTLVDGAASFTGKLDEPGHLLCSVSGTVGGKPFSALAGAAIDPLQIKPSLPVPDDFDAFWADQKKRLAKVPMNPQLTPVPTPASTDVEAFDVRVDCGGKAPVSGYYVRPKGAKPKSLPIILLVQGAGVRSSDLANATAWCRNGFLAMDINAHGIDNGKPAEFYKDLEQNALKDYRNAGRNSRETSYFVSMFLREVRAVDFLTSQPEWDGRTVIASGGSQGGFQSFAIAAIDDRISFFSAGVPAGCDHSGMLVNRTSGWPKLVPIGAGGKPDSAVLEASRYVDVVNFAARTKAKGAFVTVGFIDVTCPATSVYAAYNALPIPKKIYNDIGFGHASSPAANTARKDAILQFVKSLR